MTKAPPPIQDPWGVTKDGSPFGFIDAHGLTELWFHTGTACNLACPFCLEGSKPGDDRLERISLDDARPYIDAACELGVEQFSFTGGEPFIVKAFVDILAYAAERKPCLVLTNGTDPVLKRMDQIGRLRESRFPVSFRISIDYPDAARHDTAREPGNFLKSWACMRQLHDLGFRVSLARQSDPDEDTDAVEAAFRELFERFGLPSTTAIVAFPDFLTPGSIAAVPEVTESCMTTYHTAEGRRGFMCAYSRMIVKQAGAMRVYACTLVDDDTRYDLGSELEKSIAARIRLAHHRCYSCFAHGASCSER